MQNTVVNTISIGIYKYTSTNSNTVIANNNFSNIKISSLKNTDTNIPENIINNNYFYYLYSQRLLIALKDEFSKALT
ncbi:hypothetical protein PCHAJ_000224300 [Plasmodium chabaudi chabaudi]|uniref:Uncharacterized protein n=1 Tax=Plasmodium chabaudi chabaudi TaxID=31271 RepID=A0A1C6XDF2_PLACU|nr:hypothetical protein PCHAJ_000224300 [Plasmodium chabaudi chabaudi]